MEIIRVSMNEEGVLKKLSPAEEAQMAPGSEEPQVVAERTLPDGTLISTAFIPVCLTDEGGHPLCFESVVVSGHKSRTVRQYSELAAALRGHDEIVAGLE